MFRTSTPVASSDFINRSQELALLDSHVAKLLAGVPSWVALLGPRKIGKTSLVLEMARRLGGRTNSPIAVVVIDSFEDLPLSPEIFRRYALRTLDAVFARETGASLEAAAATPSAFRGLLQEAPGMSRLPPALRAWILDLVDRPPHEDFIRGCLELPQKLAGALDILLLVAWDEFQELASSSSGTRLPVDVLPLARSIWQRHDRVSYVISGSARSMLRDLVTAQHSPFFQHFALLEVGPFGREEAIRLLIEGSAGERAIPRSIATRAAEILGGYPFYLQLLGEALEREPGRLDGRALKAALQSLLFSRTGRLALYFEGQFRELVGRSTYLAAALRTLCFGSKRLSEIAGAIRATPGATIGYLERLGDAVVRGDDGAYRLDDPTFGLWLRWREPGGAVVPMTLVGDEAEQAVAARLAQLGFDLVYQSRASRGAFDLLALRGSEQLGIQVKRARLPVRIPGVEWARMEAEGRRFGWDWAVAASDEGGGVTFLDPARARGTRDRRLDAGAAIENLLAWVDRGRGVRPSARGRRSRLPRR